MKLKKIKVKKNKNTMNRADLLKPRETSQVALGFIIVTSLLFLIAGYFIFGIWIALPFTILYLLLLLR